MLKNYLMTSYHLYLLCHKCKNCSGLCKRSPYQFMALVKFCNLCPSIKDRKYVFQPNGLHLHYNLGRYTICLYSHILFWCSTMCSTGSTPVVGNLNITYNTIIKTSDKNKRKTDNGLHVRFLHTRSNFSSCHLSILFKTSSRLIK